MSTPVTETVHSEPIIHQHSLLPNQNEEALSDLDDDECLEVPVVSVVQDNFFNLNSTWIAKGSSRYNGQSVSKALHQGAARLLEKSNYTKMNSIEQYAVALSHSGIIDPSCDFQLQFVLDLNDEADRINFKREALENFKLEKIEPFRFSDDQNEIITEIHEI
ncbi:hypothetical protein HK096_003869 [Nowakowskiella sp. JEL0078]|nr:hypothetical protein HK096_003869 [Nowakowskiella sp. JEL0078]